MSLVRDPGLNQCERDTFKSAQAGHFGQESVFFSTFFSDPSTSSVKGHGDGEISPGGHAATAATLPALI